MAAQRSSRALRILTYTTGTTILGGSIIYFVNRPRHIPGQEAAAVPPPTYGEGGIFQPPVFPQVDSRDGMIERLRNSCKDNASPEGRVTGAVKGLLGGAKKMSGFGEKREQEAENGEETTSTEDEPYDLLIIGGGATGSGIALDAVTRGLKVAVVERDDFSAGTSSKSTKLVHGGVRYLEKAVFELDYNQ